MHSPTRWITRRTSLGSPCSTRQRRISLICRGTHASTRCGVVGRRYCRRSRGRVSHALYSRTSFSSLPPDVRHAARAFGSSPRELRADRDEFVQLPTVFRQDKALTSLGGKPLFVLSADVGQMSGWGEAQKKLAALSTNSVHETTHGATHSALLEDRNFAAVSSRAIGAVVQSVRTDAPLVR